VNQEQLLWARADGWCVAGRAGLDGRRYDMIPYDTMIFTCAQKLTYSQLNLPDGTKQKRIMKKLKIKTEMLRRNGPVIKPNCSLRRRAYYCCDCQLLSKH